MGTQGTGRKRSTKKERSTAEDDALNLIAREAEARLAAKRAARAEAREIRMKELERQQKEIFQVQKKYYGLNTKLDDRSDSKWGDIEQWMEDSERYSRSSVTHTLSDEDERMSVGSRGSVRSDLDAVGAYAGGGSSSNSSKKSKKKKKHKHKDRDRNGCDDDYSTISSRSSRLSDESSRLSRSSRLDLTASYASSDLYKLNGLSSSRNPGSTFNGYQSSLYEDSLCSGSRRVTGSTSHPLEYSSYRSSGSRVSSRANSARTSPVDNCGSVASYLRSAANSSGLPRDLDDVTIPDFSDVEDRDYLEKGSRAASALTAGTLTSLGGTSSRRGSGETAITVDAETSLREIKEIHELKDQIQDVETKYTQNLKEVKDTLAEVEEKYRKAMVSNAQLDNEKNNLMYQVDTLKDSLMELEELLSESRRGFDEKVKDFEREKHAHSVLQFQFNEMKETLKQSEELLNEIRQLRMKQEGFVREISDLQETVEWKDKKIGALERQKEYTDAIRIERDELREEVVTLKDILKKHGIVLGPDLNINGDIGETQVDGSPSEDPASPSAQDSQTPAEGNSMLEIRLRKLVDEREKMIEQVKKLKAQLDEKTQKNGTDNSSSPDGEILENGNDPNVIEMQRDSNRQMSDLKFKLVKAEQEVTALEQNVTRLEGQVTRYKSASENAEKVEDELKAEKRKLQRELRSALDKVDELESNNSHLSKRLEKIKSTRGMAQTP
ncbi:leucine-rich repeat flightless-interacting protein 2 [Tautogolabrus adspersus]